MKIYFVSAIYDIHNIGIHVVDFVRFWGSVSEWSIFAYEDEDGHLIKGVTATGNVTLELFLHEAGR